MEDIFAPDPEFRQGQYMKLSDNVNKWEEQVYSNLSNVIPNELGISISLHWSKVDDQAGYGVGSAVLKSGKAQAGVPLIVKQWHLAPLDTILLSEDKAYPLNAQTLGEIFGGGGVSEETVSKRAPMSLYDSGEQYESTYPPVGGGRYVYSSANALLEMAIGTAREAHLEDFRKHASAEDVIAAASRNGHYDLFSKIAAVKGKEKSDKKSKKSIIQVRKTGINDYSILGNPEGVFDPVMNNVDRPTMRKFVERVVGPGEAEAEAVSRIDKNKSYQINAPKVRLGMAVSEPAERKLGEHGKVTLYQKQRTKASNAEKTGVYGVKDATGAISYGYLFPNVISFSNSKSGEKVFVGRVVSAVQPRIAGIPSPDREFDLPDTDMEPGKLGVLAYINEKGSAVCTLPFKVMYKKGHDCHSGVTVKDFHGNTCTLIQGHSVEGMVKLDAKKSKWLGPIANGPVYQYPRKMRFIELGTIKKVPSSPDEHEKLAAASHDSNPIRIMRSNDRFVFKGPDLSKYASVNGVNFNFNAMSHDDAKFVLASFGCPDEEAAAALDVNTALNEVSIHGLELPKLASEIPEDDLLERVCDELRCNLVKEAAVMDESEPVDAALSLGFINPENIGKFVESLPRLKEILSSLSKMLIASRLGMANIPEDAVKSAIESISRVITGLKKLGLMKQKPDQ